MIKQAQLLVALALVGLTVTAEAGPRARATAARGLDVTPLSDSMVLRAEVATADLATIDQKPFRVFVYSTLPGKVTLALVSDQFEATVTPSPEWTGFPALARTTAEYFTVTLHRRPGMTGPCDVILKLYRQEGDKTELALCSSLAEAVDGYVVPLFASLPFDGKTSPVAWGRSLSLTRFLEFKRQGEVWQDTGLARSRLQLAADNKNLLLFVCFMWVLPGSGQLHFYVANGLDGKPVTITVDRTTGVITSEPKLEGMVCRKCEDDPLMRMEPKDPFKMPPAAMYECSIPRAALGIAVNGVFFANADFQAGSSVLCWRGNPVSGRNPVTYGRFVIEK